MSAARSVDHCGIRISYRLLDPKSRFRLAKRRTVASMRTCTRRSDIVELTAQLVNTGMENQ